MNYAVPGGGPRSRVHQHVDRLRRLRRRCTRCSASRTPVPTACTCRWRRRPTSRWRRDCSRTACDMKAVLMGTGYGQDFLDSPAAKALPDSTIFLDRLQAGGAQGRGHQAVPGRPEEVRRTSPGVPDYGMYTGYVLADYAIAAMQKAGKDLTRQAFVDGGPRNRPVRPGRSRPASRSTSASAAAARFRRRRADAAQAGRRQVRARSRRAASRSSRSSSVHPQALAANKAAPRSRRRRPPPPHPGLAVSPTTVAIPETLDEVLTPELAHRDAVVSVPRGSASPTSSRARSSSACRRMPGSGSSASPRSRPGSHRPCVRRATSPSPDG